MDIDELNKLIEEIEKDNKEYKYTLEKIKKALQDKRKKRRLQQIKKILIAIGIPLSIVGVISLFLLIRKEINNIYNGQNLKISSSEIEKIKTKIEEELNISINEKEINNYLMLNAIIENTKLIEEEKLETMQDAIILIKDNPYLNKECTYQALLNVDITYKERPSTKKESIIGEYHQEDFIIYYKNNIYIYDNCVENVFEHELIHCLLINYQNRKCPYFLKEGLTELLATEYFTKNPYIQTTCYPFEVLTVKILCELLSEQTILKSYTTGNMYLIYDKLSKIDEKENAKQFIEEVNRILYRRNKGQSITKEEVENIHYRFLKYYLLAFNDNLNQENYERYLKYLTIFDCLAEEDYYLSFLSTSEKVNVKKLYFNHPKINTLKRAVDHHLN